jgi:signal transduction histidine kinase
MHDTLAHSLSALAVQLEALDTLQEIDPDAATAQLAKIRQHARVGLDEARRAILDLRSAPVEELGLAKAIEQMVTRFGQRNGIRTSCTLEGDSFPLLPAQANALYRIVEEALRNVEQHAEAQTVAVGLTYGSGVTVSVQDDGRGFDPTEVEMGRYGLVGIRERAMLIDGQMSVDSSPDRGTSLTVRIAEPWEE